jgi:ppGpp synthetase/RelA/SpoT-type nucleotidyltranferase
MTDPDKDTPNFDFEAHRREAMDRYARVRSNFQEFAFVIRSVLRDAIERKQLKVHSVEARAKSLESFGEKSMTPSETDPSAPKYEDPIKDMTDLAAVRAITFFPRTVGEVDACIREEFSVIEQVDHTQLLQQEDRLGYQSVHYLIQLTGRRTSLPEYQRFAGLTAEIQVRTVLQHAWAEIEHDIQYKSAVTIPTEIKRRFMSLAGLLEIADREFQAIQDSDASMREDARASLRKGDFANVEITPDALRAYLDKKYGPDDRMSHYNYDWNARLLRRLGFTDFRQVDECISAFDDDKISRAIDGTRQGQLRRFEYVLLAAMGDEFLRRHPWSQDPWYVDAVSRKLASLRAVGMGPGSYTPGPAMSDEVRVRP